MVITIYICVVAFIIGSMFFIKIRVELRLCKKSNKQVFLIEIYIFKELKIYERDIIGIFEQKEGVNDYQFSVIYKKAAAAAKLIKKFSKSIRTMLDRILIKELKIHLTAGTGDSFMTGIMNGLLWMLTAFIDVFISNNVRIQKKSIIIKSSFKEKTLKMDTYCIIILRIAYIMEVAVKILILYYKEKINDKKRRCFNCLNIQ
jgi:hypothetical protein